MADGSNQAHAFLRGQADPRSEPFCDDSTRFRVLDPCVALANVVKHGGQQDLVVVAEGACYLWRTGIELVCGDDGAGLGDGAHRVDIHRVRVERGDVRPGA